MTRKPGTFVVLLIIAVLPIYVGVGLSACKGADESERQRHLETIRQANTRDIVRSAIFVQHHAADNLCFAAYWKRYNNNGPAMATLAVVPCEKVKHLLVNPEPSEESSE